MQAYASPFLGREDQPGRRASPLGILEKTRSWVVEAVHASLHRATQLHVSLDAFWTRFHRTAIPKAVQDEHFARRSGPVLGLVLDTGGRRWPSVQTSEGRHSNRQAHQQNGSEASGPVSDASSHEHPSIPEPYSAPGGIMDTLDRSRRAAISAARDAARRARDLAEGLEALARALDMMAVELPAAGSPDAGVGEPRAREGELWTTVEVARYLKTSRSWVYQSVAAGRLPHVRIGALLRFEANAIRSWSRAGT